MDLYTTISYELAERVTTRYSTSFSLSSRLFDRSIRPSIYAIYGMVRIADEIVDTYTGDDALERLDAFEQEVYQAMTTRYSTNPIAHAFADTTQKFSIDRSLIAPFFVSMRMDTSPQEFDEKTYKTYIYGSAEVVGLMCLKVFVGGDDREYEQLRTGAEALGAAYQKVNFLRDVAADHDTLGRVYFPNVDYAAFDEPAKQAIIDDITHDFVHARHAVDQLPASARRAVRASMYYYQALLHRLSQAPVEAIKTERLRISNVRKLLLLARAAVGL